jgi:hypothetical protein
MQRDTPVDAIRRVFKTHGPYMSVEDEAAIEERCLAGYDTGDLALRTCLCGARLGGADDLHSHLEQQVVQALGRWSH